MNEESAFLRAICEHPDEDTPRLVFADWLTEQGGAVNLAWATGIRAQVALARGATDESLHFQTCVFDSRYGQEKLRERLGLPQEVVSGWERGFPSEAEGYFRELRAVWRRFAFRIPIRKLSVYDLTEADAARLVKWPALNMLRDLSCRCRWNAPQADIIPTLAGCGELRGLKSLHLYNTRLTDATVTVLLSSPHLAGLVSLQLGDEGSASTLSDAVRNQLTARFGRDVFDDAIPF